MNYISPSQISTFYQCPYKYYCKYVAKRPKIKRDESAMHFGLCVHEIIPDYYNMIENKTPGHEALEYLERAFTNGADHRVSSMQNKFKRVQRNFQRWDIERMKSGKSKPLFTEKAIKAALFPGLPLIFGKVDAYFEDTRMWVDWKTGSYEEMNFERMIQGKCYEMLLEHEGYPVKEGKFINLDNDIKHSLPRLKDSWLKEKITKMVNEIEAGHFPAKPNNFCNNYCEYKASCDLRYKCPWGVFGW